MGMHTALIGLIGSIDEIATRDQRSQLRQGATPEIIKQIQSQVREKLIQKLAGRFGSLEAAHQATSENKRRLIGIIIKDAARGTVTPLMQ